MSRQPTARQGKKLGRYRIERELGRGGMGVVYLAEDENTGRLVALKTTAVAGLGGGQASRNQRRQRFVREVQALTQVNHENVVHVFDAGEADDADLGWLLFYSMDFVDGLTLAQLVQQRGPLEPRAGAAVLMQVAAGLGAAHLSGIVHRDVKPANIFISLDGHALIGDFGICKIEGSTQITRRDQLVGTPNYLAPEQILGEEVSAATDVFALGALYYVITMNRPLRSHVDAANLLKSAQGNEPKERMLQEHNVPDGLRKVIAKCLERDPKKRWKDGNDLAEALSDHATHVPLLREQTVGDVLKGSTSTQDRSNPFASMSDSLPEANVGDVQEVGEHADPSDVEAAARAMEADLAKRFGAPASRGKETPARGAEAPLPVARTESTVMFNLRAMEEEEAEKKQKALPVARTESTAIFQMREEGGRSLRGPGAVRVRDEQRLNQTFVGDDGEDERDRTPAGDMSDVDTQRLPPSPRPGDGRSVDDDTNDTTSRPDPNFPAPHVRTFAPPQPRKPRKNPLQPLLDRVPRPILLAATLAFGLVCGLVVAIGFAPAKPEPRKVVASDELVLPHRPSICPDRQVTPAEDVQSAELSAKAMDLITQRGGAPTEAMEHLESAMKANPYNHRAFYEWAKRVSEPEKQRQAYICVCLISAASTECQNAMKHALKVKRVSVGAPAATPPAR